MLKLGNKRTISHSPNTTEVNIFIQHPYEMGQTYLVHLCSAFTNGILLILCGIICIVHSFFPFLFTYTTSTYVEKIVNRMNSKIAYTHSEIIDRKIQQ